MVLMIGLARMSAAACHRPKPDLHVVEATGNTIRCGLSSGMISLQSSSDSDVTDNGIDHPNSSDINEVPQGILTDVVSLSMARSSRPAGHPLQEELAPSCGSNPKETHVSVHLTI